MVQVSYPGVYVREVSSGVRTVTGVSTAIAAFIGMARRGPVGEPRRVLGFIDYERLFSSDTSLGELTDQVRQFFQNGGQQAFIVRVADQALPSELTLKKFFGSRRVDVDRRQPWHGRSTAPRERGLQYGEPRTHVQPAALPGGARRERQPHDPGRRASPGFLAESGRRALRHDGARPVVGIGQRRRPRQRTRSHRGLLDRRSALERRSRRDQRCHHGHRRHYRELRIRVGSRDAVTVILPA